MQFLKLVIVESTNYMIPKEIQYMMFSSEPEVIPAAPAPQKVETQGCLITTILTLIDPFTSRIWEKIL